jgi:hypothetical protein
MELVGVRCAGCGSCEPVGDIDAPVLWFGGRCVCQRIVVAASAGDSHSAAIDDHGTLFLWGENSHGKLSFSDGYDRCVPCARTCHSVSSPCPNLHVFPAPALMWGMGICGCALGTAFQSPQVFRVRLVRHPHSAPLSATPHSHAPVPTHVYRNTHPLSNSPPPPTHTHTFTHTHTHALAFWWSLPPPPIPPIPLPLSPVAGTAPPPSPASPTSPRVAAWWTPAPWSP